MSTTPEEDLAAASQTYGPKRVKTPNMEVEQFDPLTVQKAQERANAQVPLFGGFGITIASPNCTKYRKK